jgi:hypothetical protein
MLLSIKILTILVDNNIFLTFLVNKDKSKNTCFSISELGNKHV